jgi:prephenate dehydratase
MTIVAFQGESGAYSEEALIQYFGEGVATLPCHAFEHLFAAVESSKADYAVLPVENSTAGSINKSFDLLLDHDVKVHGEILLRVRHCLLTIPGQKGAIHEVRSHPQALAQCEEFLNRNKYVAVPWYDTAGSAKDLAAKPAEGVGVIASKLSAKKYGLEIVQEGVEDLRNNFTRFFVIGMGDAEVREQCKTSLVFAIPNTPGSLLHALNEFAHRRINLTKLESRPRRNRPWQYVFYLDFDGHWQDPQAREALVQLLSRAAFVKLLGSYPAAVSMEEEVTAQSQVLQI